MTLDEAQVEATIAASPASLIEVVPSESVHDKKPRVYNDFTTPADIEYSNCEDALYNDSRPSISIKAEKPIHRLMIFLKAQGLSNTEISERLGLTLAWITQVTRQSWFRLRLVDELKRAGRDGLHELIKTEGENSFNTMVEIRDDVKAPASVRLAAADKIMDRIMGKPVQKSEVRTTVAAPESVAELDKEIAELQAEAARLTGSAN